MQAGQDSTKRIQNNLHNIKTCSRADTYHTFYCSHAFFLHCFCCARIDNGNPRPREGKCQQNVFFLEIVGFRAFRRLEIGFLQRNLCILIRSRVFVDSRQGENVRWSGHMAFTMNEITRDVIWFNLPIMLRASCKQHKPNIFFRFFFFHLLDLFGITLFVCSCGRRRGCECSTCILIDVSAINPAKKLTQTNTRTQCANGISIPYTKSIKISVSDYKHAREFLHIFSHVECACCHILLRSVFLSSFVRHSSQALSSLIRWYPWNWLDRLIYSQWTSFAPMAKYKHCTHTHTHTHNQFRV